MDLPTIPFLSNFDAPMPIALSPTAGDRALGPGTPLTHLTIRWRSSVARLLFLLLLAIVGRFLPKLAEQVGAGGWKKMI
jgi:hypothetical protein